jgi:6-phospho-3-hexuloisomerase
VRTRWAAALGDLAHVLRGVKEVHVKALEREILLSKRVFVTGLGRTGLMARSFAMRLMHLGRRIYHVGDVITPAIRDDDLLVICTRTGSSRILAHYVDIARKNRARVAVVTAVAESPTARRADVVLAIDDRPVRRRAPRDRRMLPLGSLFEQALLVVLDQVVLDLMEELDLTEGDLARIHTTFE